MKDQVITYRGASINRSEIERQDTELHHFHPCDETVLYRGATGPANFETHTKHLRKVSYRGATSEIEI